MLPVGDIWLVRHGETEWSAQGRHTSRTDVPLTAVGEEQARGMTFRLNRDWAVVLCSPLQRARKTAELAGFAPHVDPDLSEWDYGDAEGLTTEQLSTQMPWNVWDHPLGETLDEVAERCRRVLSRLPDDDALIFAHGHVLRILATVYLGLPPIAARHLTLDAARMGVLGHEHTWPALRVWNV